MEAEGNRELWEEMAARWDRRRDLLWGSTREVSDWLVRRLDPQPGQTILELAAGTGETGFLAAERLGPEGLLISSDRSPSMVEAARRNAERLGLTNVEFRVLDGERLELEDASVDGILSRFGYILKGDPPRALQEARRVLRPGGRLAFSVWAARQQNAWMTVPTDVMVELGFMEPPGPRADDPLQGRSVDSVCRVVEEAGFTDSSAREMETAYRFADAGQLWAFVSELRGPIALAIEGLGSEERAAVREAVESRAERSIDGGYTLAGTSLNVVAS
jgi:ubiquinone/menaquinone biosynthesis C-methylase UbiE